MFQILTPLISQSHLTGDRHLPTTASLNVVSSPSPFQMGACTIRPASTARIWWRRLYHLLPSLRQVMYSTIGTKKAARILPLPDASGSQAKTAYCLCSSIWNTATVSTTVPLTSSPLIKPPQFGSTVVVLLPRLRRTFTVPPPNSFLHHVHARSNQRCGSLVSGLQVRVNSIYSPAMLLARRLFSNITRSVRWTSKNRPTSESKLHNVSPNGFPHAAQNSLWTSHLCGLRPVTINNLTSTLIESSLRTTDSPHI